MGDDNWSRMEKLMSFETIIAIANSLKKLSAKQSKLFSIVLHGGEPFLLGAKKMDAYFGQLREALPNEYPISIQTNGILLTNELLDICSKYHVSVAVSLDGPKAINDQLRVSHKNTGTFYEVIKGYELLKKHPDALFLNAGLLAVIDPNSDPQEVYSFFKSIDAPSVDFLYKDGNHSRLPMGKATIDSTEYGSWMTGLLHAYLNDENPLPIRILDDMLKVLLGGVVSKEGMGITDFGIIIIDTDGTVMKNDTLKSSYNGADKFSKPINIKDGTLEEFLKTDEFKAYREMQKPRSSKCLNCPVLNICGGGMMLHRWKDDTGFDNPSVYCADQLYLIEQIKQILSKFDLTHA
jgi:uncharacterized protein